MWMKCLLDSAKQQLQKCVPYISLPVLRKTSIALVILYMALSRWKRGKCYCYSFTAVSLTSCYNNDSKRLHHSCHKDRSSVFARWRHCAPPSNTWFFGLPDYTPLTPNIISMGSAVFVGLTIMGNKQTDHAVPSAVYTASMIRMQCD